MLIGILVEQAQIGLGLPLELGPRSLRIRTFCQKYVSTAVSPFVRSRIVTSRVFYGPTFTFSVICDLSRRFKHVHSVTKKFAWI